MNSEDTLEFCKSDIHDMLDKIKILGKVSHFSHVLPFMFRKIPRLREGHRA